jgi:hypothetical protein
MHYVAALLFLLMAAVPAWSAPQVTAEVKEYDFGEIVQGDKVDYTFRFRNTGDELLIIDSVHSSCGCTAALLSSTRIAPGDAGEIKTTFDSSNFRNAIHKTITMVSNDPEQATLRFQITGQVKEELVMQPARIGLGQLAPGEQVEERVAVINSSRQAITLEAPKSTNPSIQASLDRTTLAPGEQAVLKVTAQVPTEAKRLSGYVMIGTSYGKVPNLRLPVSASVAQ